VTKLRIVLIVVVTALVVSVLGACGEPEVSAQGTDGKNIETLGTDLLPADLLGLKVQAEDISGTIASEQRTYVEATSLYSLRSDDLLQATLQVSRFNSDADADSPGFRRSLLNQIGGSRPRAVRLGDETIYLTSGTKQQLAVWFRGRHLLVLATREDYPRPKSLLRRALEVQP